MTSATLQADLSHAVNLAGNDVQIAQERRAPRSPRHGPNPPCATPGCLNLSRSLTGLRECYTCKDHRYGRWVKPQPPCRQCGAEIPKGRTQLRKLCDDCRPGPFHGPWPTVCVGCAGPLPSNAGRKGGKPHVKCARCRRAVKDMTRQKRNKRIAVTFVESIDVRVLAQRDGWVCQLCQRRVNPRWVYPSGRSASIDHVIPVSAGGEHSYRNCQLAHLSCNKRKNTRAVGEQLRLVG